MGERVLTPLLPFLMSASHMSLWKIHMYPNTTVLFQQPPF